MGEPSHGGLHTTKHDGSVGEELSQDAGIDGGGIIGAETGLASSSVGVIAAQPFVGGVMVDHGVHVAGGNPEEKARSPQLLEVAEVVLPVGLRQNGHAQSFALEHTTDDRRTERRMVHVSVTVHDNDIHVVPTQIVELLLGNR